MNKNVKNSTATLIIFFSILFCVCGYFPILLHDNSENTVEDTTIIDVTSMQLNSLKIENENLKKELEKYQNSPENLLIELRNSYEAKDYDNANNLIEKIHKLANGTTFDIEAQKISQQIKEFNEKTDIQKAKEIIEIKNTSVKKNYAYYYNASNNLFDNMSVLISYKINTTQSIRMVDFSISALNSNNEVINFNTNSSLTKDSITVYLPTTETNCTNTFDKEWDNLAIKKIVINSITLTYSDGSKDFLKHLDGFNYSFVSHTKPIEKPLNTSSNTSNIVEKIEETVYITSTGTKYHRSSCSYLKSKISITKNNAIKQGYTPCSRCNP